MKLPVSDNDLRDGNGMLLEAWHQCHYSAEARAKVLNSIGLQFKQLIALCEGIQLSVLFLGTQ